MNKWYYSLILLFLIASCEDEIIVEPSIYFGSSSAIVNGEEWVADVRAQYSVSDYNYLLLSIDKFEDNILRQALYFKLISLNDITPQILISDIDNSCNLKCASLSTGYDDQAGDSYNIIESDDSEDWIVIDSLDNQTLEFWGRFQASFVRDERVPKMDTYPDTIYFENGLFNGKILE